MKNKFVFFAKTSLLLVYLVIVAGALVRMTGSGMGCPDWPKCFGYYIPPTDVKELMWSPNREFEAGQVIIKDEKLWVAKDDFITGTSYDASHWRPYTKHDYAIFNPTHTWIEYLNRLVGALAGLTVLLMAVFSLAFWKEKKIITLLSWLTVVMMGAQAWLGATVVYSVLNPVKITLHMVVALLIVAAIIFVVRKAKINTGNGNAADTIFHKLIIFALLLTLVQIALGTQVRQFVDGQVKLLGEENIGSALNNPSLVFYIHRSFSFVVLGINLLLFYRNRKYKLGFVAMNVVMRIILVEILSGVLIYYLDFPFGSQTFHLVMASLLFGLQFSVLVASAEAKKIKL
ncbi:MAG: heme A synthase [Flavobacterium sp. BFFFF1]|uniref:COX15/CtaA family protein n=1 Tax=Flavobacterium sp. BFFFF1 TaxID=2015557 RepID=UPI000BC807BE|nr:COX15/CtaA family protein [Flavobacterium sp. BFFFF1]OYU81880.1 MAG: heme A synthase [Flavobacterium sp. BFFFF1]